jgi:hypothetical protein
MRALALHHHDTLRPRLQRRHRIAAEEGIAGQALAAHDTLQQERPFRSRGQREEGGDGRAHVAGNGAVDGHGQARGGEPLVLVVAEGVHGLLRCRRTSITRETATPRWCSATRRW